MFNLKKYKIFLGIYVLMAISLGLSFIFISGHFIQHNSEELAVQNTKEIIIKTENELNRFLINGVELLTILYDNLYFQDYLNASNSALRSYLREDVISIFSIMVQSNKNILQMKYIDADGDEKIKIYKEKKKVISASDENLLNKKDLYHFQHSQISINPFYSEIQYYEKFENPTIKAIMPIFIDDAFTGILEIDFDIHTLIESITSSSVYNVLLFNDYGYSIMSPYPMNNRDLYSQQYIDNNYDMWDLAILDGYEISDCGFPVTKMLEFDYSVDNGVGIIIELSNNYKDEIEKKTTHSVFILFNPYFDNLCYSMRFYF